MFAETSSCTYILIKVLFVKWDSKWNLLNKVVLIFQILYARGGRGHVRKTKFILFQCNLTDRKITISRDYNNRLLVDAIISQAIRGMIQNGGETVVSSENVYPTESWDLECCHFSLHTWTTPASSRSYFAAHFRDLHSDCITRSWTSSTSKARIL